MNMSREEMLLNEILDGGAIDRQWSQWSELAERDTALWRRLAEAQRDQLALERAMAQAAHVAESSTARSIGSAETDSCDDRPVIATLPPRHGQPRLAALRAWTGWAVAAALVIVVAVMQLRGPIGAAEPMVEPAVHNDNRPAAGEMTAEQAFQQYLARGREAGTVVGELPTRVLLDAQPSETGIGYDVTYLRQVKERATVPDLYEVVGQDDHGRAQLASYEPRTGAGSM